MKPILGLSALLLCITATSVFGEEPGKDFLVEGGCVLRAKAYVDPAYSTDSSRYNLEIVRTPKDTYQWDFTVAEVPGWHFTGCDGLSSSTPYGSAREMSIHTTLHQFATLEERVTFRNLDVYPLVFWGLSGAQSNSGDHRFDPTPRYLVLEKPVTMTTKSGISITLLKQNVNTLEAMLMNLNGNPSALFIQIKTTPNTKQVQLPLSPLYQKHHKPLSIKLECEKPNAMNWYMADNTYDTIAVSLPNLKTVKHLDTLTLVVRQRVDLKSIPISLQVPISRNNDSP